MDSAIILCAAVALQMTVWCAQNEILSELIMFWLYVKSYR